MGNLDYPPFPDRFFTVFSLVIAVVVFLIYGDLTMNPFNALAGICVVALMIYACCYVVWLFMKETY